jgi:hypothetical protein
VPRAATAPTARRPSSVAAVPREQMSVERRVAAVSSHLRVPVDSCHPLRSTAAASTGTFAAKIGGSVAPGWEPVRTAFAENFAQRDELGASCCVTYKGEVVVDLCAYYTGLLCRRL